MSNADRVLAAVLAGFVLLPCGACSQRWAFAPQGGVGTMDTSQTPPFRAGLSADPTARSGSWTNSDGAQSTDPGTSPADGTVFRTTYLITENGVVKRLPPVWDDPPCLAEASYQESCAQPGFAGRLRSMAHGTWDDIRADHANYYSWRTLGDLALGVAVAAPLANTSPDADFQDWYQRDVRSSGSDDFAAFWKTFGEGQIFIPAFAGLWLVGGPFKDYPLLGVPGEFGGRVTRGYLVGAPPMLFMQYLTGGSRPDEVSVGSQWKPFDDTNGVSGHAFMGAVPFITAAKMCDNGWAKSALYLCSTFTGWSRVNDHDHYLSQACLGWWMAYLACRNVEQTEREDEWLTFTPMITPEVAGVGMVVRR